LDIGFAVKSVLIAGRRKKLFPKLENRVKLELKSLIFRFEFQNFHPWPSSKRFFYGLMNPV